MKAIACALIWVTLAGAWLDDACGQESKTRVIEAGGGGAAVVVRPPAKQPTTYETTVKLEKARQWKSSDGKSIVAELLSWPIKGVKAAPEDVKKLKIEVVRGEKIRLRTGGKVVVLPLTRLSEGDRAKVRELAEYHETWRKPPGGQGETVRKN